MSPLILAVDTTHPWGSVALARGGEVLEEVQLQPAEGFAQIIYAHLAALLERHGVAVKDIDCYAAASGPGSFTGVRIGLACVKGLAEASRKKAVPVSNLEALAHLGKAPLRAVMLDARRGEIYGAVYDAAGAIVTPEAISKLESWKAALPEGAEVIAGDGMILAGAIAQIATKRYAKGEAQDPAALDANYVRRCDAEFFWKE